MIRSTFALVAASIIAVAGYGALGIAAHATPQPALKVIAVVVSRPHHRSAVSAVPLHATTAVQ